MKVSLMFEDGKSHKFWKISTDGNTHTVTFGRVGTDGQSKTKSFADAAAALKDAGKLVASKKKKGYTEDGTSPPTEAGPGAASESEVAAAPPQQPAPEPPAQVEPPVAPAPPADAGGPGPQDEARIAALRTALEATKYQDSAAFVRAVRECAELSDPTPLFTHVIEYANELIVHAYMNQEFDEGREVVQAYAAAFGVSGAGKVSVPRQIIASNGVVLSIFSGDPVVQSVVFDRLVPATVTHPPLAFNLACYWAKKGDLDKVLELTELALNIGKVPTDFAKDSDFAEYMEVPAFAELLAAHTPADLKELQDALKAGAKFTPDMMNELTAQWFAADASGDDGAKRQLVDIIREFGDKKAVELVKDRYDFKQRGKLFRYVCEEADTKTRNRMFKALGKSIHINDSRARRLPDEMGAFKEITDVCLMDAFLKEFPAVLLELPNLRRLDLYASKIEELPAEIGNLTQMRGLSLARNRLTTLPPEIGRLQELADLNLENNALEDLPEELCELRELRHANFSENKALPGTQLNKLFEEFHEDEVPVDLRKVLLNLLLDKKERAAELATRAHLVAALNSPIAVIRTNAMACLDSSKDGQAPLQPSKIAVLGKLHGGVKAWKERLKENGFEPLSKFAPDVPCVVLGEKPGEVDLSGFEGRVLTEVSLKRLLDAVDTPYLQDEEQTSAAAAENLGELLSSPDTANQKLALELMKTGGVPRGQLVDLLGVAYLSDDAKVRKAAMTLLKAHAPEPMQRKLAARMSFLNVSTEDKMGEYIETFAELDEIDAMVLAQKVFAATGRGAKYLLAHGDPEVQRQVLGELVEGDKLNLSYRDLEVLPDVIGEFKQLRRLILHGNKLTELPDGLWELENLELLGLSTNKLKSLPDGIARLTKLTTLDVVDNQFRQLPEVVTELTQLTTLMFYNNRVKKFPKGLSKLKNLKALRLDQMNLTDIPLEICEMKQLEELSLGYNKLTGLRPELSRLENVVKLRLGTNELQSFPEAVTTLTKLEALWIDFNQITAIPDSIAALSNLKELHCRANRGLQISQEALDALIPGCTLV